MDFDQLKNLEKLTVKRRVIYLPKQRIKLKFTDSRERVVLLLRHLQLLFFDGLNYDEKIAIFMKYFDHDDEQITRLKTIVSDCRKRIKIRRNIWDEFKKELIKHFTNERIELTLFKNDVLNYDKNEECLVKTGHISEFDKNQLLNYNQNFLSYKNIPFEIDAKLKLKMFNLITGKCGTGKSDFIHMLVYSNKNVLTILRNSLINFENDGDYLTEIDKMNSYEESEISSIIKIMYGQRDVKRIIHFIHNFPNETIGIKYLCDKKKSIFTYSNFDLMLQYILNHGYYDSKFIERLNAFLRNPENDFKYNIYIKNEILVLTKPDTTFGYLEPYELTRGEKIHLLTLLWKFVGHGVTLNNNCVLLCDEIDNNADPSLVKRIVDGLKYLAINLKVQIFFTTHNPVTMSLVPTECLLRIESKENTIIVKNVSSKKECIESVTDKIVFINEPYKEIFVEGTNDDKIFYSLIIKQLGFEDDKNQIFLKSMGNRQFNQYFFNNTSTTTETIDNIYGINDRDEFLIEAYRIFEFKELAIQVQKVCEKFNKRHFMPKRRNLENYICDPIYVFFLIFHLKNKDPNDKRWMNNPKQEQLNKAFSELFDQLNYENLKNNDFIKYFIETRSIKKLIEKFSKENNSELKEFLNRIVANFAKNIRKEEKLKKETNANFRDFNDHHTIKNHVLLDYFNQFKIRLFDDNCDQVEIVELKDFNLEITYDPILLYSKNKIIREKINELIGFEKSKNKDLIEHFQEIDIFVFDDLKEIFQNIYSA
ncbi:unnamed protein product [Brachionus calyciflorus]|uniref:Uncharacterized protein n=1 Tax=Brachionus calyciflorus TaxID=104777 RepID=A0A814HC57_9BILA|nr:unnamed protein product [Brachionus calyciflorus]